MTALVEKKLRILFLHGYRQNHQTFYERTGGLRKFLKNRVEFIYCEAPHDVPKQLIEVTENETLEEKSDNSQKGWWLKSSENPERNVQNDFEKTLNQINDVFSTNKIDGVWGFSMGGIVASMLARICSENRQNKDTFKYKSIDFDFVIIAAASKSPECYHEIFYDSNSKICMPSLHIIGKTDKLVPENRALELAEYFVDPVIFVHDQGHFIPCNADSKKVYTDFFNKL
jgi:pimeloyl-ACP methyl ester carboxylesterase